MLLLAFTLCQFLIQLDAFMTRLFISLSTFFNFSSSLLIFVLCLTICLSKSGVSSVSTSKLVLGSQANISKVSCTSALQCLQTQTDQSRLAEKFFLRQQLPCGRGLSLKKVCMSQILKEHCLPLYKYVH